MHLGWKVTAARGYKPGWRGWIGNLFPKTQSGRMRLFDFYSRRPQPPAREAIEVMDDTNLVMQFESLGENCEFGIVQRCCGAEPLGLFRFSGSSLQNMIDVVASRGERLYTMEDIQIYIEEHFNEYNCISRHYGDFYFHSHIAVDSIDEDAMREVARKKLSYLKRRFIADVDDGQKIFVRRGLESLDTIRQLHAALNVHGANWLLWVVPADGDNQPGTIDVVQPGLLRGYVAYYKNFETGEPVDMINWVQICRKAYSLFQATKDRRLVYGSTRPKLEGADWIFAPLCKAEHRINVPSAYSDRSAVCVTLSRDMQGFEPAATTRKMTSAVQPRDIFVFSTWVWVGDQFVGNGLEVRLDQPADLVLRMADLSKRNCWQLIWASARMSEVGSIVAMLRSWAAAGSVFYVSAWTLEHGTIPTSIAPPTVWSRDVGRSLFSSVHRLASHIAGVFEPKAAAARLLEVEKGGRAWRLFVAAAEALIKDRRFDDADRVLRRAMAAYPSDRDLLKLHAWSAHVSARYDEAITRWRAALEVAPGDAVCHGALAANLRERGVLEAAEATILAALPNFPDDIVIVTEAARIAQARARYREALAHWDKALELAAPHPDWLRWRAEAVCALEDQRSAEGAPHTSSILTKGS